MRMRGYVVSIVTLTLVLLSACAPAVESNRTSAPAPAPGEQPVVRAKSITIGIQREPNSVDNSFTPAGGSLTAGGASNIRPIVHDNLSAAAAATSEYEALLAVELPSVDKGTWRVNPDGSMDMTWKLRPNIKWHDGRPFTSDDLLFTFKVRRDPDLGIRNEGGGRPELMESASAPDPLTFVVHWERVYVRAHEATGLEPLPKHLLGSVYEQNKETLLDSRYFTTDFVGLGPYRIVRWEQGSHVEFARFDDYYLGRPLVDQVVLRFVPDANTLVANILAAAVDVVITDGIDIQTALEVKRRWEGTGNRVEFFESGGLHQLELQHRPDYARPHNTWTVRAVRQALYRSIDRAALSEVMSAGVLPVADSWYSPGDAARKDVEVSITQFPYDLNRAQQELAQEGWVRGPDRMLVHQGTGERFETAIMAKATSGTERALNVIASGWKDLGIQATFDILTPANQNDRQYQSLRPGPYFTSPSGANFYDNRIHSSAITRSENRWTGTNRGGYNNPRVDAILDKLQSTIVPRDRTVLHRELLREQMDDIALMPLVWEMVPVLMLKGIAGPHLSGNEGTHQIHLWDRQ